LPQKESFGENDSGAFFEIKLGSHTVKEEGLSIKTLRKKAYKRLFFDILDNKITTEPSE